MNMNSRYNTGKVVELTGVSGVGKSTWLKSKEDGENTILALNTRKRCLPGKAFIDTLFRLPYIFITAKPISLANFLWLLNSCMKLDESMFMKINVFRNCLLKFLYQKDALALIKKNNHRVIYIDEGISHIPFLLQNQDNSDFEIGQFFLRFKKVLSGINVACLDPDVDTFSRLKSRGHKRLKNKNDNEVTSFITMNRTTLSIIKKNSSVFSNFYLITGIQN